MEVRGTIESNYICLSNDEDSRCYQHREPSERQVRNRVELSLSSQTEPPMRMIPNARGRCKTDIEALAPIRGKSASFRLPPRDSPRYGEDGDTSTTPPFRSLAALHTDSMGIVAGNRVRTRHLRMDTRPGRVVGRRSVLLPPFLLFLLLNLLSCCSASSSFSSSVTMVDAEHTRC